MNVILGGGISGLIYSFYHKDHFIITDQVGGQMNSEFDIGPRYLHYKSEKIRDFLQSLSMSAETSMIKVGFLDDTGWIKDPDISFRQKYYMKSRRASDLSGFDSSVMNTNLKEFEVLNVDFKRIVFELFDRISNRIYHGEAKKIDLEKRELKVDVCGKLLITAFDKLVSTIPLNVFSKLSNLNLDLKAFDMTYCLVPNSFFDMEKFDFVYDCRSTTQYHRLTKCKQGIVLDFFGNKKPANVDFNNSKTFKNNQIISLDKDFELKDKSIKFLGRFATWNRRWKTETVIEEAQKSE